jgi:hypothetical protein
VAIATSVRITATVVAVIVGKAVAFVGVMLAQVVCCGVILALVHHKNTAHSNASTFSGNSQQLHQQQFNLAVPHLHVRGNEHV